MAKVFKSKIFLGIICLILAAAIAFLVLPNFYASKSVTQTEMSSSRASNCIRRSGETRIMRKSQKQRPREEWS